MNSLESSGASVVLDNVDDYLAPSQACINPAFQPKDAENIDADKKAPAPAAAPAAPPSAAVVVPRRRRRVVRRPVVVTEQEPSIDNTNTEEAPTPTPTPTPKKETKEQEAVKASMADCLACSGCVTTAETVLMEQHHSLTSLRLKLQAGSTSTQKKTRRALTLSPNSMADLCRHWSLSTPATNWENDGMTASSVSLLAVLLQEVLQVNVLIDGNVPLEWTWQDEADEFVEQYRKRHDAAGKEAKNNLQGTSSSNSNGNSTTKKKTTTTTPPPSMAMDATRTMYYLPDGTTPVVTQPITTAQEDSTSMDIDTDTDPQQTTTTTSSISTSLPLISGSCPALVCLVEKSMHSLVSHLSRTLSPMSRMGWALKENEMNTTTTTATTTAVVEWEHWAVQPCHDKKLEASRKDFCQTTTSTTTTTDASLSLENDTTAAVAATTTNNVQAVDLVITSVELVELVEEWRQQQQQQSKNDDSSSSCLSSMRDYLESLAAATTTTTTSNAVAAAHIWCPGDQWSLHELEQQVEKHSVVVWTNSLDQQSTSPTMNSISSTSSTTTTATATAMTANKQMAFASGGHADYIFRHAARELFGVTLDGDVQWQPSFNSSNTANTNGTGTGTAVIKSLRLANQQKKQQSYQACLYRRQTKDESGSSLIISQTPSNDDSSSVPIFKFGIVRGMQTMQRALKDLEDNAENLDYLEAMACPHGCVNGGGSIRTTSTATTTTASSTILVKETPSETKARVAQTLDRLVVVPPSTKIAAPSGGNRGRYQTRYHVVPPMNYTMGAAAGVKVQDMQW